MTQKYRKGEEPRKVDPFQLPQIVVPIKQIKNKFPNMILDNLSNYNYYFYFLEKKQYKNSQQYLVFVTIIASDTRHF